MCVMICVQKLIFIFLFIQIYTFLSIQYVAANKNTMTLGMRVQLFMAAVKTDKYKFTKMEKVVWKYSGIIIRNNIVRSGLRRDR